MPNVSIILVII